MVPPVYFLQKDRILPVWVFLLEMKTYLLEKIQVLQKYAEKKIGKFQFCNYGGSEESRKFPKLPILWQKPVMGISKISQNSQFCGLPNSCKIGYMRL